MEGAKGVEQPELATGQLLLHNATIKASKMAEQSIAALGGDPMYGKMNFSCSRPCLFFIMELH